MLHTIILSVISTLLTSAVWFLFANVPLYSHMKYSVFTLVLAANALGAESGLPDFLPSGTRVVFGFQVRRLLDSALIQSVTQSLPEQIRPGTAAGALAAAGQGAGQMAAEWQKIVALSGFDPLKDIDEVLIVAAGGRNPPMLVIAHGNFNMERFSANAGLYHGVPVLRNDKSSTGTIALLDASTAILGETAEVRAAIDRRGSGSSIEAAMASTIASLRTRYDVWGLGNGPGKLVPQLSQPGALDSIDRFQFGLSLTHGLELAVELQAHSPKDAAKLLQSAQFLELTLKSQPGAGAAKLDIHEDQGTIKLALTVSEAECKHAIEAWRAAQSRKLAAAAAPVHSLTVTGVTVTGATGAATGALPAPASQTKPASGGTMVFTLPGQRP
jgi:hypothetical protein